MIAEIVYSKRGSALNLVPALLVLSWCSYLMLFAFKDTHQEMFAYGTQELRDLLNLFWKPPIIWIILDKVIKFLLFG